MENLGSAMWAPGSLAMGLVASLERGRALRAEDAAADSQQAAAIYSAAARGHAAAAAELRMRALMAEADAEVAREDLAEERRANAELRHQLTVALECARLLMEDINALKARAN